MDVDLSDLLHQDFHRQGPVSSWTLRVENLGKLQTAELQLRPLMLLVGENNTGKTYLATMLYSIFRELPRLFPAAPPTSDLYAACKSWVLSFLKGGDLKHSLTTDECAPFLRWLNEIISEHSAELIALAFNHETQQATTIEICDLTLLRPLSLSVQGAGSSEEDYRYFAEIEGAFIELPDDLHDNTSIYQLVQFIVMSMIEAGPSVTVYLPASRTGIVHLYQEAQLRSIDRRRLRPHQKEPTAKLTPPVLDMIVDLTRTDPEDASRFAEEARILEQTCLQGSVEREAIPGGGYRYLPSSSVSLPMALSSAVVTELVPIILTLRHKLSLSLLILDEPEAHLHPKLQRVLAQTIVTLVRKGLRVCLTTHSENFCQQINNFIKIGALPDPAAVAQQLGYSPNSYLRSDEVVGYEFKNRGDHAEMQRLPQSDTGLSMPLFNEELLKLTEETLKLDELLGRKVDEE